MHNTSTASKVTSRIPKYLLIAFLVWFSLAFLIYPVYTIISSSFFQEGTFTLSAIEKVLKSDRALFAIRNSVLTALVITVTATIVGVLQVLITDYFDIKGSKVLRLAYMTPLVFGGLVLNNGYLFVYGPNGIVTQALLAIFPNMDPNWFVGAPAVFFVMTFGTTHTFMIFFRNAIRGLDNNLIDAAKNLGSGTFEILAKIVLPSLKPTLFTLLIMTFATGLNAFSAPLMVGGQKFQTIAPLILTFSARPNSRDIAALLSVLLGLSQMILLGILTWNESRGNYMSVSKSKSVLVKQKITNPVARIMVYGVALILFVIHATPAVMIVLSSFMTTQAISRNQFGLDAFTLDHYQHVLTNARNLAPLLRSLLFSGIAAISAVILLLVVVRLVMNKKEHRLVRLLEYPFYIPWLVPSILLALGFILAYDRPHGLLLGNSVIGKQWILPLAYMIVVFPTTIRYLKAAYYNFDQGLEDASRNLGAGSLRTFIQIILPALMPTVLALVALNFNANLAEYNMSAFLYPPGRETMGIIIQTNSSAQATVDAKAINMVYSVILMVISSLIIYFVYGRGDKMTRRQAGLE